METMTSMVETRTRGAESAVPSPNTLILFRPSDQDGAPNQVGRIVTLYGDGLLFRYELSADGDDPAKAYLKDGTNLKLKFRQPFAVKDYYFEMTATIVEVVEMDTDESEPLLGARVRYTEIKDEDRSHLDEFVANQAKWRDEVAK